MKAVVCTQYGGPEVLEVQEVSQPVIGETEVLIKVMASTVTAADTMMRQANPPISRLFMGFSKPKHPIMGTGFAGIIEAVGSQVKAWQPGDAVFGETGITFGANAEYICMPVDGVILKKPDYLPFEEAATLTDGPLTSINFLKNLGEIKAGQRVLINGASGSLGTAAVQLAKYYGAEVTAVCSGRNEAFVRSLGADEVVDYTKEDFTATGQTYDIIYDTVGKRSFSECKKALTPDGRYISPVLNLGLLFRMLWTSLFSQKKARFTATGLMAAPDLRQLLTELLPLLESGELRILIDQRLPLEKAVEAHQYVDKGRKRGNVVLQVGAVLITN